MRSKPPEREASTALLSYDVSTQVMNWLVVMAGSYSWCSQSYFGILTLRTVSSMAGSMAKVKGVRQLFDHNRKYYNIP